MEKRDNYQPSDSELEILHFLWEHEPATVRILHEHINKEREVPIGYTTVLKQMQRLFDKGVVSRELAGKTHLYKTVVRQHQVQQSMFRQFVDRVYQGSAMKLVMHALGSDDTSPEEIEALQEWIKKQKELDDA